MNTFIFNVAKTASLGLALGVTLFACNGNSGNNSGGSVGTEESDLQASPTLSSTIPPDVSADATTEELGVFAWQEFVALNWEAKSGERFTASPSSFADMPDNPDTTVWMTWAHRTEYIPTNNTLGPINAQPDYTYKIIPSMGTSASSNTLQLFNNLDEDNEIGSCFIFNKTQSNETNMVLYQAKVNDVEFDYSRTFATLQDFHAAKVATKMQLAEDSTYWEGQSSAIPCAQNVPLDKRSTTLCFPCGDIDGSTGAMEIKTAWRLLTAAEAADASFLASIIHSKAIYYTNAADPTDHSMADRRDGKPSYYQEGTFGLIGIHIIHKSKNYPSFTFATFEHASVRTPGKYQYLTYDLGNSSSLDPRDTMLHDVIDVDILAATKTATDAYHSAIQAVKPNSVLLNYVLTGVQGHPTSDTNSDNYYLANYVIESDYALARFPTDTDGAKPFNVIENGMTYKMGGCQGCHGQGGQLNGADFSFVTIPNGSTDNQGFKEPDILQSLKQAQVSAYAEQKKHTPPASGN